MRSEYLSTFFLALLLGAIVYLECREVVALERIGAAYMTAGDLSTSWISGGTVRTVTTARGVGESVSAWQDRHFAAVKARMDQYPPD